MKGDAVRARAPADLAAVREVLSGLPFRLDALRHDPAARTVEFPLERRLPRRETWRFRVRQVRAVSTAGKKEQEGDFLRDLRFDPEAGRLEVEGVLLRILLDVDGLDAEALCTAAADPGPVAPGAIPEALRREEEARRGAQEEMHAGFLAAEKSHCVRATVLGAVVALAFGLLVRSHPLLLPLHLGLGGGAAYLIAWKRWATPGGAALAYAGPQMFLSAFSPFLAGANTGAALVLFGWLGLLVVGSRLGQGNLGRYGKEDRLRGGPDPFLLPTGRKTGQPPAGPPSSAGPPPPAGR